MKRTLLFACVVAAMASCSKNEVADVNAQDPNVINFSSYVGASTKAGVTTTTNILNAGVYALSPNKTTFAAPFMANEKLFRADASSAWETESINYWPTSGAVDFYAYSPYIAAPAVDENGVLTNAALAIAATADAQVDILATDALDQTKATNAAAGVSLVFDHMLSKVDFQIVVRSTKKASIDFTASSFELVGLDGAHDGLDLKGKALVNKTATHATGYTYPLTTTSAVAASRATTDTKEAVVALNGTDADAFLLLPQDLVAWEPASTTTPSLTDKLTDPDLTGAAVKMNYNLKFNGEYIVGGGTGEAAYETAYFPLNIENIKSWEAGKSYLYTITFDAKDLGNGGYEPDPDPDPKDPDDPKDPILGDGKINFTVEVTEFEKDITGELNNDPAAKK